MAIGTMLVLVALGAFAATAAGATPRRARPGTPDDGPLGLGAGRTTRCPVCREHALELVAVGGREPELSRVRCSSCRSTYIVRGTLSAMPAQRRPAA